MMVLILSSSLLSLYLADKPYGSIESSSASAQIAQEKTASELGTEGLSATAASSTLSNETTKTEASASNNTFPVYKSSAFGFEIRYPPSWRIVSSNSADGYLSSIREFNPDLRVAAKFSSPTKDNVTISADRLIAGPSVGNNNSRGIQVEEYMNNTVNLHRNSFEGFQFLGLEVGGGPQNDSDPEENNTRALEVEPIPTIYNFTYTTRTDGSNDGDNRTSSSFIPLNVMELGSIVNETAYIISYVSKPQSYSSNLPDVLQMIYSFEITNPMSAAKQISSQGQTADQARANVSQLSSNDTSAQREEQNIESNPNQPYYGTSPGTATSIQPYAPSMQLDPYGYPPSTAYPYGYPPSTAYPYGYPPSTAYPYGYPPSTAYPYDYMPYYPYNDVYPPIYPGSSSPTIYDYNTYNDTSGVFHVVGEIENTTPTLINSVQVSATFYNSANQLIATKFGYTNPPSINPAQRALFDLAFPAGTFSVNQVAQWTLNLVWQ
jgi:hypothetical protein